MQAKSTSAGTAHVTRRTSREARLEVALAARDAMRARGEVPPLPDPCGRSRLERVLRYVAYEDCRRRRDAGVATAEELTYIEQRFAHLSAWRKAKNARRQRLSRAGVDVGDDRGPQPAKKKKKKRDTSRARPPPLFVAAPGVDIDDERPRLRGPDDLRALLDTKQKASG
jgi:hypothetical protein